MGAGWNQVGNVAGGLPSAFDQNRLHIPGMSGKHAQGNPRNDFAVSTQQLHLPAFDQGIVIFGEIADRVALILVGVSPFAFLRVVGGTGESCEYPASLADRVPAAVVEVQVRVDDD